MQINNVLISLATIGCALRQPLREKLTFQQMARVQFPKCAAVFQNILSDIAIRIWVKRLKWYYFGRFCFDVLRLYFLWMLCSIGWEMVG